MVSGNYWVSPPHPADGREDEAANLALAIRVMTGMTGRAADQIREMTTEKTNPSVNPARPKAML